MKSKAYLIMIMQITVNYKKIYNLLFSSVDIMKQKLDPEKLGIILLNPFMDEFYPEERRSVPDVFRLWHYNGIPGSNDGHQVKYNAGSAVLLETDVGQMINCSNPMLMCLQTKWPLIEVTWSARTPSLN